MTPSRRDVLRAGALGGLSLALGGATGCGDNDGPSSDVTALILDPSTDALTVAIWTRDGDGADIDVSRDGELVQAARFDGGVDADGSIAGGVVVRGLAPDAAYEIAIRTDGGARLGPLRARTAPRPDDPRPIRLCISADFDPTPEFESGLTDAMRAAAPELYISIGDAPYTDNGPIAQTVAEYRQRHAALRTWPPARTLHEAVGMAAIYDDHEFRNNWDAHFAAVEADRYAAAMQVWDEFYPVRGATGEVRYRSWRWGAHCECFLLDCRRFRSADLDPDGADKTMLGPAQLAWLLGGLAASTATWKLVLTSVPLDYGTGGDDWTAFSRERAALFAGVLGIGGVVFVSGDQHWFAAQRHAHGIREFQIGPLARGIGTPPPAAPGVMFRALRYNAGLVDIDGDTLVFTGLGDDGETFYSEALTVFDATPR